MADWATFGCMAAQVKVMRAWPVAAYRLSGSPVCDESTDEAGVYMQM